jgi:uncharacterized protein (TIGR02145 family)
MIASVVMQPQINRSKAESVAISALILPAMEGTVEDTCTITNLSPSSQVLDTCDFSATVSTNNPTGYKYTLNMVAEAATNHDNLCLRHASYSTTACSSVNASRKFTPVSSSTAVASLPVDRWGVSIDNAVTPTYATYQPTPSYSATGLTARDQSTNIIGQVTTARVGAKADMSLYSGTYAGRLLATIAMNSRPVPVITAVSPATGDEGTPVTITGTNFNYLYQVNFAANACTSLTVVNTTTATCAAPAGSGTVTLSSTSVYGDTDASSVQFEYIVAPTTMGSLTGNYCTNQMTTYDGTNPSALLQLSDPRGVSQTYTVGRLADGNCWMLDNLKLGLTTSKLTLTTADTNITSDWVLPAVSTSSSIYYDDAIVDGPVPGDTGAGATNYGYLYNWCAATAGGTASGGSDTCTVSTVQPSDATGDICPTGWRLPTGNPTGEFAVLNGSMQAGSLAAASTTNYYSNWQFTSIFRGVFSGSRWNSSWVSQGSYGYLWSSSTYPGYPDNVFDLTIGPSSIAPSSGDSRGTSLAVRCILQI